MLINSRFKMIVCDMAGTIIKENNIVYKTLYEVIKLFNNSLLQEDINKFKGFNKLEVIDHFVKKQELPLRESRLLIKQSNNKFNSLLKEKYSLDKNVKLIHPHLPNLFNTLRDNDKKIVLNTGYNKQIQNILINKFNLNKCIDDYISSEEVKIGRPYPYMIYNLMERNNIENINQVIKIGDTPVDILEGQNAGCFTIGVLSGASTYEELNAASPNIIINDIMDIKFI